MRPDNKSALTVSFVSKIRQHILYKPLHLVIRRLLNNTLQPTIKFLYRYSR